MALSNFSSVRLASTFLGFIYLVLLWLLSKELLKLFIELFLEDEGEDYIFLFGGFFAIFLLHFPGGRAYRDLERLYFIFFDCYRASATFFEAYCLD